MKRWVWRILAFLLIGAVINVAVAWAISAWSVVDLNQTGMIRRGFVLKSGERVPYLRWRQPGIDLVKWHLFYDRGESVPSPLESPPSWSGVASRAAYNPPGAPFFVNVRVEVGTGWPLRSMRCCYAVQDPPGRRHWEPPHGAIPLPDHATPPSWSLARVRAIPLMPAWPGFAANTAVFAAALAGPFMAFGYLRHWSRRRRGLCPHCAYPVGTSPVCTECGKPVKPRAAAAT